jgi:uncharacterized protein with GYD domain
MPYITFISQTKTTQQERQPTKEGVKVIRYLKDLKEKSPRSIDIHNIYLPLGQFDSIIIFDAPSNNKALKFATDVGMSTGNMVETVPLVPIDEI